MPDETIYKDTIQQDTMWPSKMLHEHRKRTKLHQKLVRTMMNTVTQWNLIEPQDSIMVAISGGKDSYTLLDLMWEAKLKAPFHFEMVAVHLDQVQPGYDGEPLKQWLQQSKIPYEVVQEDTYTIVKDNTKAGQAYCFLCSRLRRGILYANAERLGCNKIALGHHRDDALETLMLNLMYAGKIQSMPPAYITDDKKFTVIRPLIDCAEETIRQFSLEREYPILPCNLCGSQDGLKRDAVADLLVHLETMNPDVRAVMHHALSNIRPTHMHDENVLSAWNAQQQEQKEPVVASSTPRRMTGRIVAQTPFSGVRKGLALLPVIQEVEEQF